MKSTSSSFIRTIKTLCKAYGLDLDSINLKTDLVYLKLCYPPDSGYMPLVIETLTDYQISIAHYYQQNGDLIPDPEVVLYAYPNPCDHRWIPVSITHPAPFGTYIASVLEDGQIVRFSPSQQCDIASFCSMWGQNIKAQRWFLERGKPNPELTVTVTLNGQSLKQPA